MADALRPPKLNKKRTLMANYYPLLSGIINALKNSSSELRRQIYENARTGFLEQMRKHDPPLTDSHITQEQIAFEEAIRKVEAEQMGRAQKREEHVEQRQR
jgi:hypothetical protein